MEEDMMEIPTLVVCKVAGSFERPLGLGQAGFDWTDVLSSVGILPLDSRDTP